MRKSKCREVGEIGSESREKGDLLPVFLPLPNRGDALLDEWDALESLQRRSPTVCIILSQVQIG